ncbi:hypothetical protein C4K23_2554 [Pseudomonas chlororaphis]|nr:hypothetical protein C4K23_2554 [Pseudomonas chlororaphis]
MLYALPAYQYRTKLIFPTIDFLRTFFPYGNILVGNHGVAS